MTEPTVVALAIRGRATDPSLPPDAGGKARGLEKIVAAGLRTAPWFVVPATFRPPGATAVIAGPLAEHVAESCRRLMLDGAVGLAVRSSALDEDGGTRSFAGQHLTILNVPDVPGVLEAIGRCWASAEEPSVAAYRSALGLPPRSPGMAVIVQAMVKAKCSGVAFSEAPDLPPGSSPDEGSNESVVVATRGLGPPLVSGEVNGDEYRVRGDGTVMVRRTDPGAPRLDALPGGGVARSEATMEGDLPDAGVETAATRRTRRCLDDREARAIAEAARRLARLEGAPQDIEWATTADGSLYVLQARPITARVAISAETGPHGLPGSDRAVRIWDNANIVESFPGVTLPLTYSVAREAYAAVYRGACRSLGVGTAALDANADVFEQMIGHIEGRVYYNVSSWHRVLALLPGFGANQQFLERMMGAARPGGRAGERAEQVGAGRRHLLDAAGVGLRSGAGVVLFERRARSFERLIRDVARESRASGVESMSIEELIEHYDGVRARALGSWHVTIFNDLAVMVVHGALRRATERWLGPAGGPVVNRLLRTGALASTAPAAELRTIARRLRGEPEWQALLDRGDDPLERLRSDPSLGELHRLVESYLARWGDRCPGELQLDRPTFREDPSQVLAVIRALASVPEVLPAVPSEADRAAAWDDLREALLAAPKPVREARFRLIRSLVEMTRYRLRWRERMRFARTQVFAIGRRIFRSMDQRLVEAGVLERPGDLHYLDIAEVRGAIRGTIPAVDLRVIVRDRRSRFARFASEPGPPSRFETSGPVLLADHSPRTVAAGSPAATRLAGIPVCAGVVRGPCLPVEDPRGVAPRPGEIVVARSTDPGWVPTLLPAAGLLVERGSLLSHSAIVARELGLPTIVGIDGLTAAAAPGRIADMDGSSGVVSFEPVQGRSAAEPERLR